MSGSHANMAGFVYMNGGTVRNAFSLSILKNDNIASAGFAMKNAVESQDGTLVNCYYFYDPSPTDPKQKINTALAQVDDTFGIQKLTKEQFANYTNYFADFSYTNEASTQAIWFMPTSTTSQMFV